MSANGYKIKVNSEVENKEAQELFFKLGYIWKTGLGTKNLASKFLYAKNGILTMGLDSDNFDDSENKEITLEELQNLVNGNENGLISGKDALIALANGEKVEYLYGTKWGSVTGNQILITAITGDKFKFRLKPKSITLNGIEVPAPFEPKNNQQIWVLDTQNPCGYKSIIHHIGCKHDLCWETEKQTQQVVAALRSVFACN